MTVDDRTSIHDLLVAYCYAVDDLDDLESLVALFASDGALDLTAIGLSAFDGREAVRGFFTGVFADMTHHAHYLTNFRLLGISADRARAQAYVIGMGRSRDGNAVTVHVRYTLDAVRDAGAWRIARLAIAPLMPLPGSLKAIHGAR